MSTLKNRLGAAESGTAAQMTLISERQGELIFRVISNVLDALDLTPEQRTLGAKVAARELRAVAKQEEEREQQ